MHLRHTAMIIMAHLAMSPSGQAQDYLLRVPILKSFLDKKKPCYIWVASVHMEPRIDPKAFVGPDVLCVWDGVIGKGTIGEKSGCMLGFFSTKAARYAPVLRDDDAPTVAEGKKCSPSVALALMKSRAWPAHPENPILALFALAAPLYTNRDNLEIGGSGAVQKFTGALRNEVCDQMGDRRAALGCK